MGIAGWMARKGAVGGTARWAAKGYHALIRDNPDGTHFHLLMFLYAALDRQYNRWLQL